MYKTRNYEVKNVQANGNGCRPAQHGGNRTFKPATPKGHDAVLKAIQDSGREITITMQSGEKINGKVVARDKFTISVRVSDALGGYLTYVVYKHAMESFYAQEDKAQVTE